MTGELLNDTFGCSRCVFSKFPSQRAWPYFCDLGAGAREIRPAKKLWYFVFLSRIRDVKFLFVKIG